MQSSITSGPNDSTAEAFLAKLLQAKRYALTHLVHGLTRKNRREMRETICRQVLRAERTLERNRLRKCAEMRREFAHESPTGIQARLIDAGLIPDVRVKVKD